MMDFGWSAYYKFNMDGVGVVEPVFDAESKSP